MKEPLKVSTARHPQGQAVIRIEGSVDLSTFKRFEAAFRWFDEQKLAYLVVDMTLLSYMASSGFGLLIKAKSDCAAKKGDVVLVRPPPVILDVLKLLGLISLFRVAASVEEALLPPA
ncbi:MAG TPA: STAS domain-containing protein [Planctomycetota bacterium]